MVMVLGTCSGCPCQRKQPMEIPCILWSYRLAESLALLAQLSCSVQKHPTEWRVVTSAACTGGNGWKTFWIQSKVYSVTHCSDCSCNAIVNTVGLAYNPQDRAVFRNVVNSVWFLVVVCFLTMLSMAITANITQQWGWDASPSER